MHILIFLFRGNLTMTTSRDIKSAMKQSNHSVTTCRT